MDSILRTSRNVPGRCSCIQMVSGSVNIVTCENNVFHFITAEIMLKATHLNEMMLCLWRITRKRKRLNFRMVSGKFMGNFSQRHCLVLASVSAGSDGHLDSPLCCSPHDLPKNISLMLLICLKYLRFTIIH